MEAPALRFVQAPRDNRTCFLSGFSRMEPSPVALRSAGRKEGWQADLQDCSKRLRKRFARTGQSYHCIWTQHAVHFRFWQILPGLRWYRLCIASVPASQPVDRACSGGIRVNCCWRWKLCRLGPMKSASQASLVHVRKVANARGPDMCCQGCRLLGRCPMKSISPQASVHLKAPAWGFVCSCFPGSAPRIQNLPGLWPSAAGCLAGAGKFSAVFAR